MKGGYSIISCVLAKNPMLVNKLRKDNFSKNARLIVIDEVWITSAEYLVLLDSRLRLIYNSNKPFGRKHMLLSSDFLQMESIIGSQLCKTLYIQVITDTVQTRDLFSMPKLLHIKDQVRSDYKI